MNQSESKPVFYLFLSNPMTGSELLETYFTLNDLLWEMDYVKRVHPNIKMSVTVMPANKQPWLNDILIRDHLL